MRSNALKRLVGVLWVEFEQVIENLVCINPTIWNDIEVLMLFRFVFLGVMMYPREEVYLPSLNEFAKPQIKKIFSIITYR